MLAQHGADLALGSRYTAGGGSEGWPLQRRILAHPGIGEPRLHPSEDRLVIAALVRRLGGIGFDWTSVVIVCII